MKDFLKWARNHPLGVYIQVGACLALIVFGVFSYLSITACGEPSPGCGPTGGSNQTGQAAIVNPDGSAQINYGVALKNVSGTASAIPGAQVSRVIGWTGTQPTQLIWNPPPDSKNFVFTDPAKQPQSGGPPFVFPTPPNSIPVQFNMPTLPAGKTSMKVTETVGYIDVSGKSYTSLVTQLQNGLGNAAEVLPDLLSPPQPFPKLLGRRSLPLVWCAGSISRASPSIRPAASR